MVDFLQGLHYGEASKLRLPARTDGSSLWFRAAQKDGEERGLVLFPGQIDLCLRRLQLLACFVSAAGRRLLGVRGDFCSPLRLRTARLDDSQPPGASLGKRDGAVWAHHLPKQGKLGKS